MEQSAEKILHITIGTHPAKELNLEQEIRLAKTALLYADHVKLYSLTSSALRMASRFGNLPLDYKLKVLEQVTPFISSQNESKNLVNFFDSFRKLTKKRFLNRSELILKKQFENMLNSQWEEMQKVASIIIQNSKIEELDRAIKDGILELHTFKNTNTNDMVANFMAESVEAAAVATTGVKRKNTRQDNKLISEFVEQVFTSISNGSTYPLFDEQTASLVRAGIQANKVVVPDFGLDRGKHVGLVKHLFEYLPTFEDATVDEILDIRKELEKPLTRFRKAIISFSQDIKSAAWEKDFPPEADKIYLRDVKPALLDIEESIKSNKFLASLLRKFAEKPAVLPMGSLFSIAISQFSSLPDELAASLGVGIASASIIYEAYDEWAKKKQDTEQNLLYFYYGVGKRLNK
jgi:hypothetical protein